MPAVTPGASPLGLDILIPVHNESENIEATLDALAAGLGALSPERVHPRVTVIYDSEQDTTLPVLTAIKQRYPFEIRLLFNPDRGVLGALKAGIRNSDQDFLLVTMADLSDDYAVLGPMIQKALDGADVVCPSRYMHGGKLYGGPPVKQLLSRLAGVSLSALAGFPTHDITNNFKLYRRSAVSGLDIESRGGFEIAMEITAKVHLNGGRIEEVPARWWDRTAGKSNFRLWKWLPRYLGWYATVLASGRPSAKEQPRLTWLVGSLLAAMLASAWYLAASPLSAPLTDSHGFRQTQTAISVWQMLIHGMRLAHYQTPVLGRPWALPMEFPLYQLAVTALIRVSGLPIETAGRLVSLGCYGAALILLFQVLKARVPEVASRLFLVSVVALSPLYLFWPHAFLIETMSLALCLGFLWLLQRGIRRGRPGWLLAAAATGSLAALVKSTSMPVYFLLALLVWFCERFRLRQRDEPPSFIGTGWILACLVLPLAAAIGWTTYSNAIRAENPLAALFLTPGALRAWTFGTLAQRGSMDVWAAILAHTQLLQHAWLEHLVVPAIPVVPAFLGVALLAGRTRRLESLLCLLLFFVNPVIFTNLHFVHAYYGVPSAFLLSLALGFAALSLLEDPRRRVRIAGTLFSVWLLASSFHNYWLSYHPLQLTTPPYPAMAAEIQRRVPVEGVVLIYGRDWNPTLPFAARRGALMDRWGLPLDSAPFKASIRATGKEAILAMVVPSNTPSAFISARCRTFGFGPTPVARVEQEDLYVATTSLVP